MFIPRLLNNVAPQSITASGSEAYYKSNLDLVLKENKQLKQRLDHLEKENRGLKKAVYDLSVRYSACSVHLGKTSKPFDIDNFNTPESASLDELDDDVRAPGVGLRRIGLKALPAPIWNRATDRRQFYHVCDLKGHTGSVYAAQFSTTHDLLASGSLDRSVRIWDVQSSREVRCFQDHKLNVSDVCWSNDGTILLSGGFDHCVKEYDVVAGKIVHSYSELQGFIQTVCFNPADNDLFLAGSTSKQIYVVDRRVKTAEAVVLRLSSDAKVNSLIVFRSGIACLSGDSYGAMKLWDLRTKASVETVYNDEAHQPITSVHVSSTPDGTRRRDVKRALRRFTSKLPHVRYEVQFNVQAHDYRCSVAVNSFDNVLRVYDAVLDVEQPQMRLGGFRLAHAITGTRIKNWPVKSTLLQGHDYWQAARRRWSSEANALTGNGEFRLRSKLSSREVGIQDSLLLASGSADNVAYIYDVSGPAGTAELVQQLEGHSNRVCGAIFYSRDPCLATYSADSTLKLWKPRLNL